MKKDTWFKRNRWWVGGLILAVLVLAAIVTVWVAQAHQFQLDLAHYLATNHKTITVPLPDRPGTLTINNPDYHLPVDTTGPGYWGWDGWTIRLLAIFAPALLGLFLYWREQRIHFVSIHKKHLDHATNKLAEAIGENQQLPEGVFDAYSRLRELEKRHPPV
jgi:hypothetical protein